MNKSEMSTVILSLHKPWWDGISSGVKTMDIRNTKPKCPPPFRVLAYQTDNVGIVGEFICSGVPEIKDYADAERKSNVPTAYIFQYAKAGKRKIYGWEVSDVKVYEKPIPLNEIGVNRAPQSWQYYQNREESK